MIDVYDSAGRKIVVDRTDGKIGKGGEGFAGHYAEQSIDGAALAAIEAILGKGDRVELIPVKDGVKVVQVQRKEVKT